jgi:glyoxylase-like metal-dependent hydrolase (beta-lactamase superfamily II)
LPWITERPLVAVASHCHFDHIAGHHEFAERLVHRAEADILAAPDGENDLSRALSATTCSRRTRTVRCATPNTA